MVIFRDPLAYCIPPQEPPLELGHDKRAKVVLAVALVLQAERNVSTTLALAKALARLEVVVVVNAASIKRQTAEPIIDPQLIEPAARLLTIERSRAFLCSI